MNNDIADAIKTMKTLSFIYDGQNRVVEPHAYGMSTAGNECLRAYQTAGGSNSGNVPGWHLFTVRKIMNLSKGSNFSGSREGYKPGDRGMTEIFIEI